MVAKWFQVLYVQRRKLPGKWWTKRSLRTAHETAVCQKRLAYVYTTSFELVNGTANSCPMSNFYPRFDEMTWKSLEVDYSFATATRLQVSEKPTPKGVIGTDIGSQ